MIVHARSPIGEQGKYHYQSVLFIGRLTHDVGLVRELDPLSIPELLLRVLELSDRQELAIVARICHRWFDTAVKLLWESLSSLDPVLLLLGTLHEIKVSQMPSPHPTTTFQK